MARDEYPLFARCCFGHQCPGGYLLHSVVVCLNLPINPDMATILHFPTRIPPGMVSPCKPASHCAPDPLLETMRRHEIELTRENYIEMATAGGAEWISEHEADLPPELR